MNTNVRTKLLTVAFAVLLVTVALVSPHVDAQKPQGKEAQETSFSPVIEEPFDVVRARDKAAKAGVMAAHERLLKERYDLTRRVDEKVTMTRGKPIPVGPTARLKGVTWERVSSETCSRK